MYFHDPIKHSRYMKQALSQGKGRIGVLLSAGCPLAVPMPKEKWPLIPDVANLTKTVSEVLSKREDLKYVLLLGELKKSGRDDANIEQILSFVRALREVSYGAEVRGLTHAELTKIENEICATISNLVAVSLPSKDSPYHRLANWIGSVQRTHAVEIFTTNYDLLIEQALEDANVAYFDGFVGSRNSFFDMRAVEDDKLPSYWARLWKLHGSLNWHVKDDRNITRSTGAHSQWTNHLIYPSHLKYDESRKMPFLALSDRLNKFLTGKGSTLVITGYSFNDEHLNECISKSLLSNPSANVFALAFGEIEKYPLGKALANRNSNLSLFAFDKAIVGTHEAPWKISAPIEDVEPSISSLISAAQDGSRTEFTIGDFNKFSLFLKFLMSEEHGAKSNEL